jgi:hypothetical protein
VAHPSSASKQPPLGFVGAVDENEGVVKRHLFVAMLCSTAWISEKVEDRSSETRTVNQFSAVVPPTIDSAYTATMILLSGSPDPASGDESAQSTLRSSLR